MHSLDLILKLNFDRFLKKFTPRAFSLEKLLRDVYFRIPSRLACFKYFYFQHKIKFRSHKVSIYHLLDIDFYPETEYAKFDFRSYLIPQNMAVL